MKRGKDLMRSHKRLMVVIIVMSFILAGVVRSNARTQPLDQPEPRPYWFWRQPPYVIVSSGGYPYIRPAVWPIAAHPTNSDVIYAGCTLADWDIQVYPRGIYRSLDRGMTWEYQGKVDPDEQIEVLLVHPITPTIVLAGFDRTYYQAGIYRSEDAGENWISVLPYLIIKDIEVSPRIPQIIYASTLASVAPPSGLAGVYRSNDVGQTWEQVSDFLFQDIEVHPITSTILFGARYYSTNPEEGIYRSDDSGASWTQVASILGISRITFDERHPRRMFAFGDGHIYRTEDGGESWTDVSSRLPSPLGYKIVASAAMDPLEEDKLWIGMRYAGMFVSPDAGETWYETNDGIYLDGGWGTDCVSVSYLADGMPVINCYGRVYIRGVLDHFVFLPLVMR